MSKIRALFQTYEGTLKCGLFIEFCIILGSLALSVAFICFASEIRHYFFATMTTAFLLYTVKDFWCNLKLLWAHQEQVKFRRESIFTN